MSFRYKNFLGRSYNFDIKNIKSVTFNIGFETTETHTFSTPISEAAAITYVEKYLSIKLDKNWFDKLGDDIFYSEESSKSYEEFINSFFPSPINRGQLLRSKYYLTRSILDNKGNLRLINKD